MSSPLRSRSRLRAPHGALYIWLSLGVAPLAVHVQTAHAVPAPAPQGPRATLQRLNGNVDKLLRAKHEPGSDEEKTAKNSIKQHASDLLDYTELCKRALSEHWEKMPEKTRTDFVSTLRELIERNYVKQLRTNLDYDVTYGDETIEGQEARVTTTLKLQTKGKSTKATIDYRLVSHDGRWMVYDVITDELSLVRNYRSQFTRIIGTSGYDGLLNKMKTKLTEERDRDAKEEKERLAKKPAAPAAPAK